MRVCVCVFTIFVFFLLFHNETISLTIQGSKSIYALHSFSLATHAFHLRKTEFYVSGFVSLSYCVTLLWQQPSLCGSGLKIVVFISCVCVCAQFIQRLICAFHCFTVGLPISGNISLSAKCFQLYLF